jgi:hypothetical protein
MRMIHRVHRFSSHRWPPPPVSHSSSFSHHFHSVFFSRHSSNRRGTSHAHLDPRSRGQSQQGFSVGFSQQPGTRSRGSGIFPSFPRFQFHVKDRRSHRNRFQGPGASDPGPPSGVRRVQAFRASFHVNHLSHRQSIGRQHVSWGSRLPSFQQGQSGRSVGIVLNPDHLGSPLSRRPHSQQSFRSPSSVSDRDPSSVVPSRVLSFPPSEAPRNDLTPSFRVHFHSHHVSLTGCRWFSSFQHPRFSLSPSSFGFFFSSSPYPCFVSTRIKADSLRPTTGMITNKKAK